MEQGRETMRWSVGQRSRSQEVKGQDHRRSKVKVTGGQRSRSQEVKGQGHSQEAEDRCGRDDVLDP